MILYFAFFLSFIGLRAVVTLPSRPYNTVYWSVLITLFVMVAFRYEVGCDWVGYQLHYQAADRLDFDSLFVRGDPLWWLWLGVVHAFNGSYEIANVLPAVLLFAGLNRLARHQTDPIAVLIFAMPIVIMGLGMSGIRQGAAWGILCFAILAFQDRKRLLFIVLVLLASGWHSSALIFFLLLPLLVAQSMRSQILMSIVLGIPIIAALLSTEAVDTALTRYTGSQAAIASGAPLRLALLASTAVLYFTVLRRKWASHGNRNEHLLTILSVAMIASLALVPFSSIIADRIGYYLIIPQLMILGSLPLFSQVRKSEVIQIFAYGIFISYFAVWTFLSSLFELCYVPYQTWIFS